MSEMSIMFYGGHRIEMDRFSPFVVTTMAICSISVFCGLLMLSFIKKWFYTIDPNKDDAYNLKRCVTIPAFIGFMQFLTVVLALIFVSVECAMKERGFGTPVTFG